jgi:hypothetical protein
MKLNLLTCEVLLGLLMLTSAAFGQNISGPLSGTLGPGIYYVVGDCQILAGNTLTIRPGTTFLHAGSYRWTIYGQLIADGTSDSLIVFTRQVPDSAHMWRGLRFYNSTANGSLLDYCTIEYIYSLSDSGSIYCRGADIDITHTTIAYCSALGGGGGIYAISSPILIEDCEIHHNTAITSGSVTGNGGGIYLMYSNTARVRRCYVHHNSSTGA